MFVVARTSGLLVGAATLSSLLGLKWASLASVQSEMEKTVMVGWPQVSQQSRFMFVEEMLHFPMQRSLRSADPDTFFPF